MPRKSSFMNEGNKSPSVASSRHKEKPGTIAGTENKKTLCLEKVKFIKSISEILQDRVGR